jgi:hypothetical protein
MRGNAAGPAAPATGKNGGACYNKTLTIATFETIFAFDGGVEFQLAGQQICACRVM